MEQPSSLPTISVDDLQCLQNPSPTFLRWVWDAHYGDRLEVPVAAAIRAGVANTVPEALAYLQSVAENNQPDKLKVAVIDLQKRTKTSRPYRQLRELVTGFSREKDVELTHGMIGHQALYALESGQLTRSRIMSQMPYANGEQLDFFPPVEPSTVVPRIGQSAELFSLAEPVGDRRLWSQRDTRGLLARIARGWVILSRDAHLFSHGWNIWRRTSPRVLRLDQHLEGVFGEWTQRIKKLGPDPYGTLQTLTFMSWAAAVAEFRARRHPRILFREIPVLSPSHHFGGGRIDALEVRSINGRRPTKRQQEVLAMIADARFRSTGELLRTLVGYFRAHLEVVIIDWKFLVGDIWQTGLKHGPLELETLPILAHANQMGRYLTMVPLDFNLGHRANRYWDLPDVTLTGDMTYLLPDQLPRHYQVDMTTAERQDRFISDVVEGWHGTTQLAIQRQMNNLLHGHLLELLDGRSGRIGRINGKYSRRQLALFETPRVSVHSMVEEHRSQHRTFVDPLGRIVEATGRRGNQRMYELHYDVLLAAMQSGEIPVVSGFTPERGGKVHCLMPTHIGERTPSMHVYLQNEPPSFFCFGCEARGLIVPESIPAELPRLPDPVLFKRNGNGHGQAKHRYASEPEEHSRIMSDAQQLLAEEFWLSQGHEYVLRERRLSPELAVQYGAGFGTGRLINGLLDQGRTLDELQFYGFVGWSEYLSGPTQGLGPLLKRRGCTDDQLRRVVRKDRDGKEVIGWPTSVLAGRVTFPLTLDGRINNFYGRATYECHRFSTHRKLSNKHTRREHGGFNMAALQPSGQAEVTIAEGAFDALTLMSLGQTHVVGMIGVANRTIVQAIANWPHQLAIAFDFDRNETGQTKTIKLVEALRTLGFNQEIRNFTAEFMATHPDFEKDFNDWWVRDQQKRETVV